MYSQEQFQQTMQKVAANQKTYTEDSIDQARTKWLDARDLRERIEKGERSIYRLDEAYQMETDAERELEDALRHAGPLAAQKRAREFAAKREQERHADQVQHSAEEKAKFRADAKTRWLASGGSEHSFNENFESLWTDELKRRVQGPSEHDIMAQRLRASGRYSL